jgi:MerR family transcriptional regulator, light-induced transcriptional regulator
LVYIRSKSVKGIEYAYLVKSVWNSKKNSSRQKTIKYLGRASSITTDDIPEDYRNDPKIITFMTSYASKDITKKQTLLLQLRDEFFKTLSNGDVSGATKIYEKYTEFYNLIDFYDNLLKPVMYEIGELWAEGKLDIATEHICSNTAQSLIGIINERNFKVYHRKTRILVCTPNGELHNLGCKVIESFLISKGFKVFNISPSVQAESVTSYIQEIEPDVVFISISLDENMKAGKNLVKKIRSIFSSPILGGGIAVAKKDKLNFDARTVPNGSLHEIETQLAYVKTSEKTDALGTKLVFRSVLEDYTFKASFVSHVFMWWNTWSSINCTFRILLFLYLKHHMTY